MKRHNERPIQKKTMRLTQRDIELLRYVTEFGGLSTEQVSRLCFRTISRARKRLRLLWAHRFLNRVVRPVRMGEGTSPFLYTVTKKGKTSMGTSGNTEILTPIRKVSLGDHNRKIADFRISLMLATKSASSPVLTSWQQRRDSKFIVTVKSADKIKSVPVVPDAFFTLEHEGKDFAFFLEIDNGTTDLGRIRTKIQAYLDLWQSKAAHLKLRIRSFRVLYVTTTRRRLTHMLMVLQGFRSTGDRRDIINLTSLERVSLARPECLFDRIWATVNEEGMVTSSVILPGSISLMLPPAPGKPPVRGPDAGAS